jgi:tetratricopeptide (TPR) repeat protein
MGWCFKLSLAVVTLAFLLSPAPAGANDYLDKGIKEYNAGNYYEAIGLLGEAEPTDFNNAVLHYYLANAYAKTSQKDDAIKEYKIALALEPQGQLASYCERALRVLHGVAPASVGGKTLKYPSGNPMLSTTGAVLPDKQMPRIICILCGCPLCHRLESILHELEAKYGDRIAFTRSMKNALDPEIKQIVQDYSAEGCPSVLLFDTQGKLVKKIDGMVAEADLRRDTEALAASAGKPRFASGGDERLAQQADSIMKDAQARVSDDRRRVDEEIKMLQNEETFMIQDLTSARRSFRTEEINEVREDIRKKIDYLNKDYDRRKGETFAAAAAKIQALESTAGGRAATGGTISGTRK